MAAVAIILLFLPIPCVDTFYDDELVAHSIYPVPDSSMCKIVMVILVDKIWW